MVLQRPDPCEGPHIRVSRRQCVLYGRAISIHGNRSNDWLPWRTSFGMRPPFQLAALAACSYRFSHEKHLAGANEWLSESGGTPCVSSHGSKGRRHTTESGQLCSLAAGRPARFSRSSSRGRSFPFYRRWSFMAVPMATISLRVDFFASSERGKKENHQNRTGESLERFHGNVQLKGLSDRRIETAPRYPSQRHLLTSLF
jgi:hypothetical protein